MLKRAVGARCFGSGGEWKGHPPHIVSSDKGLAPLMKHPDGHEDDHHAHVHPAPLDHKFIAPGVNKKFMCMDGLKGTKNAVVVMDNEFHHLNGLSMFQ